MACDLLRFYLSLPHTPVYLKEWDDYDEGTDHLAIEHEPVLRRRFCSLFIIDPSPSWLSLGGYSLEDPAVYYVRSCLFTQSLYRNLVEQDELSGFEFVLGAKIFERNDVGAADMMGRQLYALRADDVPTSADKTLFSYARNECSVWVYERDTETEEPTRLWRLKHRDCKTLLNSRPTALLVECIETPQISPIFRENRYSPVFHDYERAVQVLTLYKECREVQELLEIGAQKLADCKTLAQLEAMMKQPLVVVEGMDATGKTTLTEFLEQKLDAARYSTPPPCLLHLRRFFDKLPEIMRRAYYSLGNYIVAQQIAAECQARAVVMDRYWHSTAAYGIANETSWEDLPPPDHEDYRWPSDLLKPTAVIFLTVSEEVRQQRLGNRQDGNITFEERTLNKDQLFRKRLCEAYLRMREPACIQVDASGSKEEVVEAALKQLQLHDIQLQ